MERSCTLSLLGTIVVTIAVLPTWGPKRAAVTSGENDFDQIKEELREVLDRLGRLETSVKHYIWKEIDEESWLRENLEGPKGESGAIGPPGPHGLNEACNPIL